MIVSRMAELARLDALLAGLVCGEGGALVVHGEAGIGKTTLLDALVERCGDAVTVVTGLRGRDRGAARLLRADRPSLPAAPPAGRAAGAAGRRAHGRAGPGGARAR